MKNSITCDQCSKPVTFARFDAVSNTVLRGNYHVVGLRREGAGYGRSASWTNVYTHIGACETVWRAEHGGNGKSAAEVR